MQIIIATLLIVLIYLALQQRKKEKQEFIQEDRDEESGRYWDKTEQDWTSKREQAMLSERQNIYQQSSAEALKKQMMHFLYAQYPKLADLDSKGYAQLNALLSREAEQILKEVERLVKK